MKRSDLKRVIKEEIQKVLKEVTDYDFSGAKLKSSIKKPDMFGQQAFDEFFPKGSKSEMKAMQALKDHDRSPIKARMGQRYAPMFVHVQYHEFEDQAGEKYSVHQRQYYNSNFDKQDPKFDPGVTVLTLTKKADPDNPSPQAKKDIPLGQVIVKTDEYIKDLKQLNITKRVS
jgi:hypothetical protein